MSLKRRLRGRFPFSLLRRERFHFPLEIHPPPNLISTELQLALSVYAFCPATHEVRLLTPSGPRLLEHLFSYKTMANPFDLANNNSVGMSRGHPSYFAQ